MIMAGKTMLATEEKQDLPSDKMTMPAIAHSFDPLRDRRWDNYIGSEPRSSVFHSRAWLLALNRTYQYQPVAFTTSAPDEALQNAIVFCRVKSWLTGKRLVSLPFSDHCEPLVAGVPSVTLGAAVSVAAGDRNQIGRAHV